MSIRIPTELEAYVRTKLERGEFESEQAFAAAAMRLYREMEIRHERLQSEIDAGIAELDRGDGIYVSTDEDAKALSQGIKARGREQRGREGQSS